MQREWCEDDVWPACEECGSKNSSVRYNLGADFDRVTAERDAALGREKECQRQLGERWKDIEALRNTVESADADKEAYAQNAIDLRKRVDALQLRLTAADERADVLEGLLHKWLSQFPKQGVTGGPITTLKEETAKVLGAKESVSHA